MPNRLQHEAIADCLEDGLIVVDLGGKILSFNQAAESILGIPKSQAVGSAVGSLACAEELAPQIRLTIEEGSSRTLHDLRVAFLRGETKHLVATTSPLRDERGEITGAVTLLRDVSRLRELEEGLRQKDRLAMLGTLAAGMAHEVKNPLAGIRGAAQLLQKGTSDEEATRYSGLIVKEVDRIGRLIDELLDFSDPGKLILKPVNMNQMLHEILALQREAVDQGRYTFAEDFDPSLPPISIDGEKMTQVFLNLVRNALEAMPEGGKLTVISRIETNYHLRSAGNPTRRVVAVEISDTGCGIEEADLDRIVTPFYTTKAGGLGLGLAITQRAVQEHGGHLLFSSTAGHGTRVRVLLPFRE